MAVSEKSRTKMMEIIAKNKENYKDMDYKAEQRLKNTIFEWVKNIVKTNSFIITMSGIPKENIPKFMKNF